MDETGLRERLHVALDEVAPPADLFDRAFLALEPARRRSTRRRLLVGAVALVAVVGLIVGLTIGGGGTHRRVRVIETPTTALLAAGASISPILDFLDAHGASAAYLTAVERGVASCMQARGWEYVPRVQSPTQTYGAGNGPTDPTALLAFRKAYGYGYLNPPPNDPLPVVLADEANGQIRGALAPPDQARYDTDLGRGPDELGSGPSAPRPSGCRGQAENAERRIIPSLLPAVTHDLSLRLNGVHRDPAYLAAQQQWSACMVRAGFHFTKATDAQASISNLFIPPPTDPNASVPAAGSQAEKDAAKLEIRTGTADAECAVATVWPVQRRLEIPRLEEVIEKYGRGICGAQCPVVKR